LLQCKRTVINWSDTYHGISSISISFGTANSCTAKQYLFVVSNPFRGRYFFLIQNTMKEKVALIITMQHLGLSPPLNLTDINSLTKINTS
jgi:hypothetical protein